MCDNVTGRCKWPKSMTVMETEDSVTQSSRVSDSGTLSSDVTVNAAKLSKLLFKQSPPVPCCVINLSADSNWQKRKPWSHALLLHRAMLACLLVLDVSKLNQIWHCTSSEIYPWSQLNELLSSYCFAFVTSLSYALAELCNLNASIYYCIVVKVDQCFHCSYNPNNHNFSIICLDIIFPVDFSGIAPCSSLLSSLQVG